MEFCEKDFPVLSFGTLGSLGTLGSIDAIVNISDPKTIVSKKIESEKKIESKLSSPEISSPLCPITLDPLDEMPPSQKKTLACGHTFQKQALERALQIAYRCPVCRAPVPSTVQDERVGILQSAGIPESEINVQTRNEAMHFFNSIGFHHDSFGPIVLNTNPFSTFSIDLFHDIDPCPLVNIHESILCTRSLYDEPTKSRIASSMERYGRMLGMDCNSVRGMEIRQGIENVLDVWLFKTLSKKQERREIERDARDRASRKYILESRWEYVKEVGISALGQEYDIWFPKHGEEYKHSMIHKQEQEYQMHELNQKIYSALSEFPFHTQTDCSLYALSQIQKMGSSIIRTNQLINFSVIASIGIIILLLVRYFYAMVESENWTGFQHVLVSTILVYSGLFTACLFLLHQISLIPNFLQHEQFINVFKRHRHELCQECRARFGDIL